MPLKFKKKQETKKEFSYYKSVVEEVMIDWGLDPNSVYKENSRTWLLAQGSVYFEAGFFNYNDEDYFYVSSDIVKVTSDNKEAFYKKLLELNDQYIGVKFSINGDQVKLMSQRECDGMDTNEAKIMIDNVRIIADELDDKLIKDFGASK